MGMFTVDQSYWARSHRLVVTTLVIWALVAYVLPLLVPFTNQVIFLGFPLGYYLCSQLIPIFFAACLAVFTWRQDVIDQAQGSGPTEKSENVDANRGGFLNSLGKVYAIYTGGFLGFVLFMAFLEGMGVPDLALGILYVVFTLCVYAGIGIMSHTNDSKEYFVAGRNVPPVFNGMATAADWMSGASFVGMAGTLYALGYDGLAFIIGWTGGYVLVATLVAPYLRRAGSFTVPDFIAMRYRGTLKLRGDRAVDLGPIARFLAIIVLLSCSFTYLVAQVYSTGVIMSRFIGVKFEIAVFLGLCGVLVCSLMGGMRAVTWTQVAQYIVLIVAYIVPAICMSATVDDGFNDKNPVAQIAYGGALKLIEEKQKEMVAGGLADEGVPLYTDPVKRKIDFLTLSFCLMVGTASLPHVLMRYFTTPSVRSARKSVTWSLVFILALYLTAPAYAAFSKLEVYTNVIGQPLSEVPKWVFTYGQLGMTQLCGQNVASLKEAAEACGAVAGFDGRVRLQDLKISKDAVVIATPEIAGLPYTIAGLVSAGGLAAALSTADGLLLSISNALSHDIYFRLVNQNASKERRMCVSRSMLVVIAVLAAAVASSKPSDILSMVAWAFSLAASGNFPALVLGIWWRRANAYGAVAGIASGWGLTVVYLVGTKYGGWDLWGGISNTAAGIFGIPLGFAVNIVVSLLTPGNPQEVQEMVTKLRDCDFQGDGEKADVAEDDTVTDEDSSSSMQAVSSPEPTQQAAC